MKAEKFLKEIGEVEDRYIEEALPESLLREGDEEGKQEKGEEEKGKEERKDRISGEKLPEDRSRIHRSRRVYGGVAVAAACLLAFFGIRGFQRVKQGALDARKSGGVSSGERKEATEGNMAGENKEAAGDESMRLPNPFIEVGSLEEAEELAGFSLKTAEKVGNYERQSISVMEGEMIQVLYQNDAGEEGLRVRKGLGEGDLSGDYNSYTLDEEVEQDGVKIRLRGDGPRIFAASWTKGAYSYAIDLSDAELDRENVLQLILEID
ncbi:hypothetical protein HMPREF1986_00616 [Oribacterium sp. oral taxon 078 str. F0263]|uniref:hypothetical protein n=1 Tax=Oribacterium sp. oral taxon 078 TaxID=652706 RepID=UPI0003AE707C|nr:hypothetical protein [Oribacterium sp. oral taxon 078]ERL22351.1 hypothetical protein HMPREF1986_00616 [Oribacterium sp. oral taxon 078 str. F0263]